MIVLFSSVLPKTLTRGGITLMRAAFLLVLSFTLSVSLAVPSVTLAQQSRPRPIPIQGQTIPSGQTGMQEKGEDPIFKGITLTQGQKTQIEAIKAKYRAKRKEQRIAARKAEIAAAKSAYGNGAKIQPKPIDVSSLNAQQRAEIRALLSEEQRTVLDRNVADLPNKNLNK